LSLTRESGALDLGEANHGPRCSEAVSTQNTNEHTLEERRRIGRYAAKNSLTKKALQTLL